MDILGDSPKLDLRDSGGRIYARNYAMPSSFISESSTVSNSLIAEGAVVFGDVGHSVISSGCVIGQGAVIRDSVIMPGAVISGGCVIECTIVGEGTYIGEGAVVGEHDAFARSGGIAVIGKGRRISDGECIKAGTAV